MSAKRLFTTLAAVLVALALVVPASAEWRDMWATVYKLDYTNIGDPKLTPITSGITFQVLQAGTDTEETLYVFADKAFTSLTNPVTTSDFASSTVCNDRVAFRVDPGETNDVAVDLIVVDTAGGFTAFVEDFDANTHKIVIDERPNVMHHGMIWFNDNTTAETDTGIDFNYDTHIYRVTAEIVDTVAAATVDVGLLSSQTSGDADGLLDGVSLASAGIPTLTLTTSGALMDNGTLMDPDGHTVVASNAYSLTYTTNSNSDTDPVGYIHYYFVRQR